MSTISVGTTVGDWAIAEDVSEWIEVIAIVAITASVVVAIVGAARSFFASGGVAAIESAKQHLGRGLLLGLDLLIAADVIRTVTLEPTLENVTALGVLVVVRTFLSWALVVELEGRWPWTAARNDIGDTSDDTLESM